MRCLSARTVADKECMHVDCWDCEVHTTYGWIECAGLADRSAFDLTAHGKASKVDLVAYETFDAPKTMEVVEVVPNMKILGKELKLAGKKVADYLTSLPDEAAMALKVLCTNAETPYSFLVAYSYSSLL